MQQLHLSRNASDAVSFRLHFPFSATIPSAFALLINFLSFHGNANSRRTGFKSLL